MRNWFKIFLLFFIFGLLVYSNSLNNKFQWDDDFLLNSPTLSQTKFVFSQWDPYNNKYFVGYYRPLAHMVYSFCYGFFKDNYWQYHLLNTFLLVILAALVYLLIKKLTGNYCLAFLTGLFFLIHPINGVMVNNIVTNALTLQVIFMVATILLLWESLERNNDRIFYSLSLLVSFLSLFWYDMGVLTPVYLSAVILLLGKDPLRAKIMYLLPFFLISFTYFLFRSFFLNGTPFLTSIAAFHMTGWEYLATLFQLIKWYIIKLFSLQGIVMQWSTPIAHEHLLWYCLGAVSLLAVFIYFFLRSSKEKIIQMAIAWILIGFAPLCLIGFVNPDSGALIEPHWFIFSTMGFFILAAYLCLIVFNRMKIAGAVLLFIVVLSWGISSRAYNEVWANEKTCALFWSQELPHSRMIDTILGNAYRNEGNFKDSRKYYRLALKDKHSDQTACNNIGLMDLQEGLLERAEADFNVALLIDPHYAAAYHNLGILYLREGRWEKAKKYFYQALVYDPFLLGAREGLVSISLKNSQYKEAIDLCLKNLEIKADDSSTLILLIGAYLHQKDFIAAKKYAYRLISGENDPVILTRLGAGMVASNMVDVARDCYTKALQVAPGYKDAYLDEGTLLMNIGNYDGAIRLWNQGLLLYPSDQRFKSNIAKALALKLK